MRIKRFPTLQRSLTRIILFCGSYVREGLPLHQPLRHAIIVMGRTITWIASLECCRIPLMLSIAKVRASAALGYLSCVTSTCCTLIDALLLLRTLQRWLEARMLEQNVVQETSNVDSVSLDVALIQLAL